MTDAVDVEATNDNSATTATTTSIQLDTTKPGMHTILYTVTDPKGLTGTATRTVIISAPANVRSMFSTFRSSRRSSPSNPPLAFNFSKSASFSAAVPWISRRSAARDALTLWFFPLPQHHPSPLHSEAREFRRGPSTCDMISSDIRGGRRPSSTGVLCWRFPAGRWNTGQSHNFGSARFFGSARHNSYFTPRTDIHAGPLKTRLQWHWDVSYRRRSRVTSSVNKFVHPNAAWSTRCSSRKL